MKKFMRILPVILMVALASVFFWKIFAGYTVQGPDMSLGRLTVEAQNINHSTDLLMSYLWMNLTGGSFYPSLYTLLLKVLSPAAVLPAMFLLTALVSMLFFYLFLRRQKLSEIPAMLGAIAYAFAPHFISRISAGHHLTVELLLYGAILFYFLTVAFGKKAETQRETILQYAAMGIAGVAWGFMMNDDIQHGLYFSIIAASYLLYLVLEKNELKAIGLKKTLTSLGFWKDAAKVAGIAVVLVCSFSIGFNQWNAFLKARQSMTAGPNAGENRWAMATSYSFPPADLIDQLAFGFHGAASGDPEIPYWGSKEFTGSSDNVGFFILVLAVVAAVALWKSNGRVRLFIIMGGIFILLAFGKYFPPLFWIFYHLPLVGNFRAPDKFMAGAMFCLVYCAAFGLEFLFFGREKDPERWENWMKRFNLVLVGIVGIELIAMIAVMAASSDIAASLSSKVGSNLADTAASNITISLLRMVLFTAALLATVFIARKGPKKAWLLPSQAILIAILSLVDLWSIDWFYVNKGYMKEAEFYRPDGVTQFLTNAAPHQSRVITGLYYPGNGDSQLPPTIPTTAWRGHYLTYIFPYYSLEPMEHTAYSGNIPEYSGFFNAAAGSVLRREQPTNTEAFVRGLIRGNIRLFQMANVRYLVTDGYLYAGQRIPIYSFLTNDKGLSEVQVVMGYSNQPQAIFEVKNPLPRLGFYGQAVTASSRDQAMQAVGDPDFDFTRTLVIESPVSSASVSTQGVIAMPLSEAKPWAYESRFQTDHEGYAVLSVKDEKAWKAFIDGKPVQTIRAFGLMPAVQVGAGEHTVTFRYEENRTPFWISFSAAILGCLLLVLYSILNGRAYFEQKKLKGN